MHPTKNTSCILFVLTAMISSRAIFIFIDDPEGPNLLIVTVLAAIIYFISSALSRWIPSIKNAQGWRKIIFIILIQIIVAGFIFIMLR